MRRTLSGSAVVLALVATATLTPAPSYALLVEPEVRASTSVYAASGSGCEVTGASDRDQSGPFRDTGAWTTVTGASSGTVVDPGDAGDRSSVVGSSTGRVRSTRSGSSFRMLEFRASVRAAKSAAQGAASSCGAVASASARTVTGVVLPEAGWLTIDLDVQLNASGLDDGYVSISRDRYGFSGQTLLSTSEGPADLTVYRPAGAYYLAADLSVATNAVGTETGSLGAVVRYTPAGTATGAASGSGRRLASLPAKVSCSNGRAEVRLTSKRKALRAVSRATFTATGARKKTVRGPKARQRVVLTGLSRTRPVTIKGTFRLRGGRTLTVERDYLSCR